MAANATKTGKRSFAAIAKFDEIEIRTVKEVCNSFTAKDGKVVETHCIEIGCEQGEGDDCLTGILFYDKDMGNRGKYKRGMRGTLVVREDVEYDFRSTVKMTVVDFIEDK